MKEGTPKQLRGRSLGTRLSEDEYAQCEKAATRRGQTLSEWCRRVLLEATEETAGDAGQPETLATLAEILALRKIVINLLYGEKAGEPLDEERMRELIETADAEKLTKAAERLRALRQARAQGSSDRENRDGLICAYFSVSDQSTWQPSTTSPIPDTTPIPTGADKAWNRKLGTA